MIMIIMEDISRMLSEIEFNDDEVGNGTYRFIIFLLDIIVPILKT